MDLESMPTREHSAENQSEGESSEYASCTESQVFKATTGNLEGKKGQRNLSKRQRMKNAALNLVHPDRSDHQSSQDSPPALNHLRHEAVFNPNIVENESSRRHGKAAKIVDRGRAVAEDSIHFVVHPKKAMQRKIKESATSVFMPARQPYASITEEVRQLEEQETPWVNDDVSSDEEANSKIRAAILEERRDSVRTAWTTSRLRRIRVVRPQPRPFPTRASCQYWNETRQMSEVDWMQWIGHFMLYLMQFFTPLYIDDWDELPFDRTSIRTHLERVVLATSHWQAWAMDLRSVYRWEKPKRTAVWLMLYTVLWYTNRIMTFFWAYIIYHVLSNRFQVRTLENVRKAAQRATDRESTAFQLGELVDRHGQDGWVDELVEALGPYAQLQLDDMANLFEVLHSFYAWKSPKKTMWTLMFFATCLACSLLADTEYCMRIVWFVAGGSFFCCWPVSSCYPKYRLLVSPLKWIFWGIPTNAEVSFTFLKKHAELARHDTVERKGEGRQRRRDIYTPNQYAEVPSIEDFSAASDDQRNGTAESSSDDDWQSATSRNNEGDEGDLVSFRAYYQGSSGRVYISPEGIRFDLNHPRKQCWNILWADLDELRKAGLQGHRRVTTHGLFDSGILQLKSRSGQLYTLDPVKNRDEAFNCVIGFSRLRWQELATQPGKGRKPEKEERSIVERIIK